MFWKSRLFPALYRHFGALFCIVLTKLILQPFEKSLQVQLIVLLYLLPVIISTVLWGLTPGIVASFSAFLMFNYFYIPPYHTLVVHKTQDLITLIIFLIVAVIQSQLIGQARQGMQLARSREREATRMYELISALAGMQNPSDIALTLVSHTLETFPFDQVEVTINPQGEEPPLVISRAGKTPAEGIMSTRLPLTTARGVEGEMLIKHHQRISKEESRLLEAFTSQAALALERIRLAKSETKAHVLEESDRLKSSLLNSVSHELRSPLAAIKASVSSLRTGAVDWNTSARQDLLETIEEETDHLNTLVGNLLDMSRIESGALKPQLRWNAIGEIIMGVAMKMRKKLQDHVLEVQLPEGLPLVATDYVLIEQVFTNLISNSTKYAPPGTVIGISAAQEDNFVHIQVSNQGPPVPEEHLERIFDKFYRVTAADRVTGTGLGLSICKGIIEAHNGRIWAKNESGKFVFHFLLPLTMDGNLPDIPKEISDGERPADITH